MNIFPLQNKNNVKNVLLRTMSKIQCSKQVFIVHFPSAVNLKRIPKENLPYELRTQFTGFHFLILKVSNFFYISQVVYPIFLVQVK